MDTDTPDPVAAAVAALIEHDATCGWCTDNLGVPGAARCAERDELFAAYLIACLECGDPERPLPMPFGDQAERGKWASAHTQGTGHDRWRVWTEVRRQREESSGGG